MLVALIKKDTVKLGKEQEGSITSSEGWNLPPSCGKSTMFGVVFNLEKVDMRGEAYNSDL